jgi:hypothetical protein
MKTIYFFLALLFVESSSFANSNDSLPKSTTKKNEIGMILNPVAVVLLGASPNGQRLGITYKRKLNEANTYITSGIYYQSYKSDFERGKELTLEVNGLLRNIQYRNDITN